MALLAARPDPDAECPYPGIAPYDTRRAAYFHGRAPDVATVRGLLGRHLVVGVVGSSGSGKSSFLAAGLAPALADGSQGERWLVRILRPGAEPLNRLAAAVIDVLPHVDPENVVRELQADPTGAFVRWSQEMRAAVPGAAGVVWLVDQAEEVFDPATTPDDRAVFLRAFSGSTRAPGGPRAVVALRADFYGHLDADPELATALAAAQHRLRALDEDAIREVVTRPAEKAGLSVEPALVEAVVRDVREMASPLPLLSAAMAKTWEQRVGGRLTLAGYRAVGGVEGALRRTAAEVWGNLSGYEQESARRLLMRLVQVGDGASPTRRRVDVVELVTDVDDQARVTEVVGALTAARLLTVDVDPRRGVPAVEITHDRLLTEWDLLRRWLDENQDVKREQEELTGAAAQWQRHREDSGYLYGESRFAAVKELHAAGRIATTPMEARFLAASARAARRARGRRRALPVLASLLVLALFTTVFVTLQQQQTQQARIEATALQMAAESRSVVTEQRGVGALLALAGVATADTSITRAAVVDAIGGADGPIAYPAVASAVNALSAEALPDGSHAAGTGDGSVTTIAPDGRVGPIYVGHHEAVVAVAVVGDVIVSGDAAGELIAHHAGTAQPMARQHLGTPIAALAAGRDAATGRVVAAAATLDGGLESWTIGTPAEPVRTSVPDRAADVAFDGGGGQFVVATQAGGVTLVGLDGAPRPDLAAPGTMHAGQNRLAVDSGGHLGVVDGTSLALWDLRAGTRPRTVAAPGGEDVAFSHVTGDALVGGADGSLTPWTTGAAPVEVAPVLHGLGGRVRTVVTGPTSVIAAGADGQLVVWEEPMRHAPAGHGLARLVRADVVSVAATPGDRLVAGTDDGRLCVVEPDGRTRTFAAPAASLTAVAWAADGHVLAGARDGSLATVDTGTGAAQPLAGRPGSAVAALLVDQRGRVITGFADGTVTVDGNPVFTVPAAVTSMAVSADGSQLAVAYGEGGSVTISLRSADDGFAAERLLTGHRLRVASLAFTPDGRILASGSDDTTIRLWDTGTATSEAELDGHTDQVRALAFTRDGRTLASGSEDATIRLWDVATRTALGRPLSWNTGFVWSFAVSADDRTLTAAAGDELVAWPFSESGWRSAACQFTGHDLDTANWARYAPGRAPSALCPPR